MLICQGLTELNLMSLLSTSNSFFYLFKQYEYTSNANFGSFEKKLYRMTTFIRTVADSLIRVRDEDAIIFLIYHPVVVIIIITNVTCRTQAKNRIRNLVKLSNEFISILTQLYHTYCIECRPQGSYSNFA